MSSSLIITDPTLLNIPNFSVRLIQTYRIFDLIQQNIQSPKPIIHSHHIQNFMKRFHPEIFTHIISNNISKIMHKLNKQGQQLNQQNFAFNLAKNTKQLVLTSDQSIKYFYKQLRDFFMFKYQKPVQNFQRWDLITTQDQLKSKQWIQIRFRQIIDFHDKLKSYIDGMQIYAFQNALQQINYCLSISMLPLNQLPIDNRQMTEIQFIQVQQKMIAICNTFINPNVMQHISEFINYLRPFLMTNQSNINPFAQIIQNSDNILRYLKCMSYLYALCKYQHIKQKLQTYLCMISHDTFAILIAGLKIPVDKIRCQIAICLSLISKYIPNFIDWLLSDIQGKFVPLLQNVAGLSDDQGIYYALICLKKILKKYQTKSKEFQKNINNLGVMTKIYTFALLVLKSSQKILTQQQCILIFSQILKICSLNFNQIQQLKMTTKVFQTQQQIQKALVPATLKILQTAILTKNEDLINMMIKDQLFQNGLANSLSNRESPFFYQFLHVIYLLSFDYISYLNDKGILQRIVNMMFQYQNNPTIVSLGTDILYNIVQKSLEKQQNDLFLQLLYQKFALFERIIPFLFKKCFQKNEYGDIFMSTIDQKNDVFVPAYNYFDKYLLLTIFKILYCLSIGISRRHKKYAFSKRVNEQIVKSLANILQDLFQSQNRELIQLILRQKVKIQNYKKWSHNKTNDKSNNGIQLFKLINVLLQQMTYNMEKKSIQFLKLINYQKKSYSNNLLKSQYFSQHELEVEGIPIYLNIQFDFDQNKVKRQIPHKFELSSLKNYIKSHIAKQMQRKETQIKDVILRHHQSNRFIQNQVQFRTLVNKELEKRNVEICLEIKQIKYKSRRQDIMIGGSFVNNGIGLDSTMSQRLGNSFVGRQTTRSRVIPNNRFTELQQQNSDFRDPRRTYHTPTNFNYSNYNRSNSPIFGGGLGRSTMRN